MKDLIEKFDSAVVDITRAFMKEVFEVEDIDTYTDNEIKKLYVGESLVDVLEYNDYFVNFSDMYIALRYKMSRNDFEEWYDYNTKWGYIDPTHHINIFSWIHNCPRRSEDEYQKAFNMASRIETLKNEFENYVKSFNE